MRLVVYAASTRVLTDDTVKPYKEFIYGNSSKETRGKDWTVEGDAGDVVVDRQQDGLIGHGGDSDGRWTPAQGRGDE